MCGREYTLPIHDIVLLVDSIESEFDITLDANDITPEVFASFSSLLAQLNRIC